LGNVNSGSAGPGDIVPERYNSESDFVKALREGDIPEVFNPKDISCYFRPEVLPDNAELQYVQVSSSYIMLMYTFDKPKADDYSQQIMYKWFRGLDTEQFIGGQIERGNNEITLEGDGKSIKFYAEKDFESEKAEKENPAWVVQWVQDGECFGGNIPYNIAKDDIPKYFKMEKVTTGQ
jgi:hypothetical protein